MRALHEITRIVKPNGHILVFVWALEQPETSNLYKNRGKLTYLTENNAQETLVPWTTDDGVTRQRYYHLLKKGELEELAHRTGQLQLVFNGYDRDNWYACFETTK